MKWILGASAAAALTLAALPAFAQGASVTGVGDAAARNQLSTVGVGRQTGSGGPGYRYGGWDAPYYNGRSAYVAPYGYASPYGYAAPSGYAPYGYGYTTPYLPE